MQAAAHPAGLEERNTVERMARKNPSVNVVFPPQTRRLVRVLWRRQLREEQCYKTLISLKKLTWKNVFTNRMWQSSRWTNGEKLHLLTHANVSSRLCRSSDSSQVNLFFGQISMLVVQGIKSLKFDHVLIVWRTHIVEHDFKAECTEWTSAIAMFSHFTVSCTGRKKNNCTVLFNCGGYRLSALFVYLTLVIGNIWQVYSNQRSEIYH